MDIILKKSMIKYIIDVSMGISFLLCFFTGLMKWPGKTVGKTVPSKMITYIHDYSGIILGLIVIIHLVLNWKWIITMTNKIIHRNSNIKNR